MDIFLKDEERASRHPYYYAGLYYIQEPSAMTPASRLPVEPGDYVLDLCAAPGREEGNGNGQPARRRGDAVCKSTSAAAGLRFIEKSGDGRYSQYLRDQ